MKLPAASYGESSTVGNRVYFKFARCFGSEGCWGFIIFCQGGLFYMKALIGGAIISAIGLILLVLWWEEFLMILSGIIPVTLLLGGGLAIYLGFDELRESWSKESISSGTAAIEVEKYKHEIDELKKEIESLKKA